MEIWRYRIVHLLISLQIGTPTASVSAEVAAVQRLMKASGLSYSMHSAGTTVGKSFGGFICFGLLARFMANSHRSGTEDASSPV